MGPGRLELVGTRLVEREPPAHTQSTPGSAAAWLPGFPAGLHRASELPTWQTARAPRGWGKAGRGRVQAAHGPTGGWPRGRAPGGPQRWAVLREAKVAQVQAGGPPGLATPPPSTATGAYSPPAGHVVHKREAKKVEVSTGRSCRTQGSRHLPRSPWAPLPPSTGQAQSQRGTDSWHSPIPPLARQARVTSRKRGNP